MTSKNRLDQLTQMVSIIIGYVYDVYHITMETNDMVRVLESKVDQLTSYEVQHTALQMLGRMMDLGEVDNLNRDAVEAIMCAPDRPINADKLSQLIGGVQDE